MALSLETLARLKKLGFEDWMMGGGCHAYGRNLPGGGYELIASEGGADLPKDEAAPCNIARYSEEPDHGEDGMVSLDGWLSLTALLNDLEAQAIADKWVGLFGLGFHPDTPGKDYVVDGGTPALSEAAAAQYDADMERLAELTDQYEAGLAAMRRAGFKV